MVINDQRQIGNHLWMFPKTVGTLKKIKYDSKHHDFFYFSDSVLSMDIPSTGPTSLRSEIGDDMGPIEEAEEAFLKN